MGFSDRRYFGGSIKVKAPIGKSKITLDFSSPLAKYNNCFYDLEKVNGAYEGVKLQAYLNGVSVSNENVVITPGSATTLKDGYYVGTDSYGGTQQENGVCFKINSRVDKVSISFTNTFSSRSTIYWQNPNYTFEGDNSFCSADQCEAVFNKCDLCSPDGSGCISCNRKQNYFADFSTLPPTCKN